MLPDSVLEELGRNTPLQSYLVTAAWPSLTTESKLQLIQAIQGKGGSPCTPDWLLDLALEDAPVVRIWAARFAYFKEPVAAGTDMFGTPPNEQERALRERAINNVEPLVHAKVGQPSTFLDFDGLTQLPHLERLWAIRTTGTPNFASFIDWIEKALAAKIPVLEICECVGEFFALPDVMKEFGRDDSALDAYATMRLREAMVKGWELVKNVPIELQHTLVFRLPLQVGRHGKMTAEPLALLPPNVLNSLFYLSAADTTDELERLKTSVLKAPDQFDKDIVKTLQRECDEAYLAPSEAAVRKQRLFERRDHGQATLEVLSSLVDRFDTFEERLVELEQNLRPKKGFWS